jgi:GNAT superfamily N-acetyltransferase
VQIELLKPSEPAMGELAEILVACVTAGASVGFLRPLERGTAESFWRTALADPGALTLVARDGARIVGTVRLLPASQQNGQHRAEVAKLLVHPNARGKGVAAALMAALDHAALARGRTTLVLDTETGGQAEHLYQRWGWSRVGEIPDFALTCDGDLASTTVMTKRLGRTLIA